MHLLKNKKIILSFLVVIIIITLIFISIYIKSLNKTSQTYLPSNQDDISSNTILDENINILYANVSSNEICENNSNEIINNSVQNNVIVNSQTSNNSQNSTANYYIKVNYTANVVTIYSKDASGNYTVPIKAMVCSTGTSTPKSGVYKIPGRWQWGALFGGVYGQYVTKITGNILFHSVPYLENKNPASLEYWEYDKLGTTASAGCVRLTVTDALWIYQNCKNGTQVEFYSSTNPGPLGKPAAQKISNYESPYRNWDPTDPNNKNPWKYGVSSSSTSDNTGSSNKNELESNNTIHDKNNTSVDQNVNNTVKDTGADNNISSNVSEDTNSCNENLINNSIIENEYVNE